MLWNRVFRVNKMFPHPNYYIGMGKTDEKKPFVSWIIPRGKNQVKWVGKIEHKGSELWDNWCQTKTKKLPEIYTTFLQECKLNNQQLLYHNFLKLFHLQFNNMEMDEIFRISIFWTKKITIVTSMKKKKCPFDQKWCCQIGEQWEGEIVRKYIFYIYTQQSKEAWVSCWYLLIFFYFFIWKKISVKNPSRPRPLMIIGQDETVFKQYLFSRNCWVGPGGGIQLLPKSIGYSRMISGFASCSFGVSLHLIQNDLNEVNGQRIGSQWGEYISKNASNFYFIQSR